MDTQPSLKDTRSSKDTEDLQPSLKDSKDLQVIVLNRTPYNTPYDTEESKQLEFYTYRCHLINDPYHSLPMSPFTLSSYIVIPHSVAGYVLILSDRLKYGFDVVYDLEQDPPSYIERDDLPKYVGKKVLALMVDDRRMANYYTEENGPYKKPDKIKPILNRIEGDRYTLTFKRLFYADSGTELDIKYVKCNCKDKVMNSIAFTKEYLDSIVWTDKVIKFEDKVDLYHPVYVKNQSHTSTAHFHRKYPDLTVRANNFVICGEDPVIMMAS